MGASESTETAKDLLGRQKERNFKPAKGCRLLAVLDGSKALKEAVLSHWPDAVIQRCLVHKERNIKSFLSERYWGEVAHLFDRLRKAQGLLAGKKALKELECFLTKLNAGALESLREAGDELLAVHSLEVPQTLNPSSPVQKLSPYIPRVGP
jgi:transposase-like protein